MELQMQAEGELKLRGKGCLPLGVLVLGYQPEIETPAILNGLRPRGIDRNVLDGFTVYPTTAGHHELAVCEPSRQLPIHPAMLLH